jgi:SAM-dependent methyltransferase
MNSKIALFLKSLSNTWLYPRYIGIIYIEEAIKRVLASIQGNMLDVGCGTRRYETLFKDFVNVYIGLDWPQIQDRAQPDIIADAMKIPLKDSSMDVVLATELMEHLPFPQTFLMEIKRVLCENGTLILSVPFMEPIHEEPRDFYRFTPYSLHLLLEHHGFRIQKLWNKGGWWSVVLGSFVNQAIYDWATRLDESGRRRYSILTFLVLPICAFCQWLAYQLDRIFPSKRFTLGYTVHAIKASPLQTS